MPWWHAIAERDHEIQNPTSREKVVSLGRFLRLTPKSHVLDIACGKCGPAVILAQEFGCRITGVERAAEFVTEARRRLAAAGLEELVDVVEQDATTFDAGDERYDAALCIGASFVWRNLGGTLAALKPAVRRGGHVVVGELYFTKPLPDGIAGRRDYEEFASLAETAARFAQAELELVAFIASSRDDWDRYESLHWRAVADWLAENPDDPDAEEFRRRNDDNRRDYLAWERDTLGWGIFVARKR
jgi:ubiquinone/menaquinone biosynthesis C-methylase UbiE